LSIWVPAAVAVGGGFAARRARLLGVGAAVALCGVGVASTIGIAADRNYQRPDWRGVARVLGAHTAGGGSRAVLVQHYRDLLPLSLYLPNLKFMGPRGASVAALDIVSFASQPSPGFCW